MSPVKESTANIILSQIAQTKGVSRKQLLEGLEGRVRQACKEKNHIRQDQLCDLEDLPEDLQKHVANCGFCQLIIECEKGPS